MIYKYPENDNEEIIEKIISYNHTDVAMIEKIINYIRNNHTGN
jgi:uncharacterized protein YprB with RNaseH-like and TPR domain